MNTPGYSYPPREKFGTKAAAKYLGVAPQALHNRFLKRGPAHNHAGRLIYYLRADLVSSSARVESFPPISL
jgi:hypothetical protein